MLGKLRFNGVELKITRCNYFTGQVMQPLDLEIFKIRAAKLICLLDSIHMGMANVCLSNFPFSAILWLTNFFPVGNIFFLNVNHNALNWTMRLWCGGAADSSLASSWHR